jgi:hypothetical protein
MGERELATLKAVGLSSSAVDAEAASSALLGRYYAWDRSLRNELARLRAHRLGLAPEAYLRPELGEEGLMGLAQRVARSAFQAATPLEGEMILESERWSFVDSLSPIQTFDFESIVAYMLKLLIIARVSSFNPVSGKEGYDALYSGILGAWRSMRREYSA